MMKIKLMRPCAYRWKVSSLHGSANPGRPTHKGIDFAIQEYEDIVASAAGVVIGAEWRCNNGNQNCGGGYGNFITIEHTTESGEKFWTRYCHLNKVSVNIFQKVVQGQVIGLSGNTGHSTGPHLHFELMIKNDFTYASTLNPYPYLTVPFNPLIPIA